MRKLKLINDAIADKLADWLSTMAMFYGITILVIAPLFWQTPHGIVAWMQYAVSVFFQGVALPVLGYVAKKSGDKTETVLRETHDAVMSELKELRGIAESLRHIEDAETADDK